MGYGVYHDIVVDISSSPFLKSDDYKEPTGICSPDYEEKASDPVEECINEECQEPPRAMTSAYAGYSPSAAVAYANQYCGNSTSGTSLSGNHPSGYNYPAYVYFANADCANFVSQCLYAGNVQDNNTWKTYTSAWINVASFHAYWSSSITSQQIANYYAVAGNPVYWLNASGSSPSGHLMICVGHNAAGVALVDGHNDDMYRFPINSSAFSSHTLLTLVFSSCSHTWVPKGNCYYCPNCGLTVPQLPY